MGKKTNMDNLDKLLRGTILELPFQAVEILKKQLYWLKREDCNVTESIDESEIPHEFLCPITHEIMKEPVQCSGKI